MITSGPSSLRSGTRRAWGRRALQATLVASMAVGTNIALIAPASATPRIEFHQCINGAKPSTSTACTQFDQTTITNANSHYVEDQVVPQRLQLLIPPSNSTTVHKATVEFDTRINGVHAYDSLATWNLTQTTANRCQGVTVCPGGTARTVQIPSDPTVVQPLRAGSNGNAATSAHQLAASQRLLTMYGGFPVSVSVPVHTNAASPTGNAVARFDIFFRVPAKTVNQKVQFLFGGHLASSTGPRSWGAGGGAGSIDTVAAFRAIGFDSFVSTLGPNRFLPGAIGIAGGPAVIQTTKTPDAASVTAGDQIGFTVTARNTGTQPASNVTITDTLPVGAGLAWTESPDNASCAIAGGQLTCNVGTLAPGAQFSVRIVSPTTGDTPSPVSNTATTTATGVPPSSSTSTITLLKPSLSVLKKAVAATVDSGDGIAFTIDVANAGPGTAKNVTLSDPLPGATGVSWTLSAPVTGCAITGTAPTQSLDCSFGDLAAGASRSVGIQSATATGTSGTLSNTATADSDNTGPTSSTATITVNSPAVALTKTPDANPISSGDRLGFTLTATNNGAGTAKGVVLTDDLPAGEGLNWVIDAPANGCVLNGAVPTQSVSCPVGTLAPGASFSVHVSTPTSAATVGDITNTLKVTGTNIPPGTTTTTVTVNQPVVTVTKSAASSTVEAGDPISYTVTVSNTGAGTAKNFTVSDSLPSGNGISWSIAPAVPGCDITGSPQVLTCTVAALAPGASLAVTITSQTTSESCGVITNVASAGGGNLLLGTLTSNAATIEVLCRPVLNVGIVNDCPTPGTVVPGGFLSQTIAYSNTGSGAATAATLTADLNANHAVVDADGGTVVATPTGSTITWSVGPIPAGGSGFKVIVSRITALTGAATTAVTLASPDAAVAAASSVSVTISAAGAKAEGNAYSADVQTPIVSLDTVGQVRSGSAIAPATSAFPAVATSSLLDPITPVVVPGVAAVDLVNTSTTSSTTGQADSLARANVADVNLLGGLITADEASAVSRSTATALSAGTTSAGTTFTNLVINGTSITNVTPNQVVDVTLPVLGTVARVVLREESSSVSGPTGGFYSATHSTNLIHVNVLKNVPIMGLTAGVEIIVGHADTTATYPSGQLCTGVFTTSVEGLAFLAGVDVDLTGATNAAGLGTDAAVLPLLGGSDSSSVDTLAVGPVAINGAGTSEVEGSIAPPANARAITRADKISLLGGLVRADAVESSSVTTTGGTGPSTVLDSKVLGLAITGVASPIIRSLPNEITSIPLPGGGAIVLVTNEQSTLRDANNSVGTANAIHVYVLNALGVVTSDVIVASATSGVHL